MDGERSFVIAGEIWLVSTEPPDFGIDDPVARIAKSLYRESSTGNGGETIEYVCMFTDWDLADRFATANAAQIVELPSGYVFLELLWELQKRGDEFAGFDPTKRRAKTFARLVRIDTLVKVYGGES